MRCLSPVGRCGRVAGLLAGLAIVIVVGGPLGALARSQEAIAASTGTRMPTKDSPAVAPARPDPAVIRQGGDTIADAVVIPSLPYSITGTTAGYTDDYDEACPFTGSTAPDVVHAFTPDADVVVDIDLCGSSYDTKLYVYDAALELVACNDDAYFGEPCGLYVSALENVALAGGMAYYVVIDGYGGEAGDYILAMDERVPCVLACPAGGYLEGEPPLVDDYEDAHNGGCNSPQFGNPFQYLHGDANGELILCGTTGWYQFQGTDHRDTDWFLVEFGATGEVEVTGDAELPTYLFDLGDQQPCNLGVLQNIIVGPCDEGSMTMVEHYPHDGTTCFWVGPTTFASPSGAHPYEYDYVIHFSGLAPATVATERASWSAVKGLFR